MKQCKKCELLLDESEFSDSPRYKDKLFPYCKVCKNEYNKLYYDKNSEEQKLRIFKQRQKK